MVIHADEQKPAWEDAVITYVGDSYREGWAGVWDAIVSALTKRSRRIVRMPHSFSFWVKPATLEKHIAVLEVNNAGDTQTIIKELAGETYTPNNEGK
jgi:hypothetical protein